MGRDVFEYLFTERKTFVEEGRKVSYRSKDSPCISSISTSRIVSSTLSDCPTRGINISLLNNEKVFPFEIKAPRSLGRWNSEAGYRRSLMFLDDEKSSEARRLCLMHGSTLISAFQPPPTTSPREMQYRRGAQPPHKLFPTLPNYFQLAAAFPSELVHISGQIAPHKNHNCIKDVPHCSSPTVGAYGSKPRNGISIDLKTVTNFLTTFGYASSNARIYEHKIVRYSNLNKELENVQSNRDDSRIGRIGAHLWKVSTWTSFVMILPIRVEQVNVTPICPRPIAWKSKTYFKYRELYHLPAAPFECQTKRVKYDSKESNSSIIQV
ncbi:hypothetical protein HZH66_010347 [Vespula vulgaris]|uniref:Uncharacterized protein n=1 Tax=Vespula vulgaris TaxID=7454 RepID=A0A834MYH2_VESVU|nr:hypothetical protein HZH66_010347 [Vespula vulgaris]